MVMTRTNVLNLADSLAHSKGDSDTMTDSFDALLERLARTTAPFVETANYTPTDGTAEYSYPSAAVILLAVFHGAKQLPLTSLSELEAYDADWRDADEGTPVAYSFTERDARKVLLFPTPSTTASDGGTFLYGEQRTTDIPVFVALYIAFEILAEEFAYPSDHQDKEMAEMCAAMAKVLKQLVEV
jgi:hypothetical protein